MVSKIFAPSGIGIVCPAPFSFWYFSPLSTDPTRTVSCSTSASSVSRYAFSASSPDGLISLPMRA